jgi:hypothetical protein
MNTANEVNNNNNLLLLLGTSTKLRFKKPDLCPSAWLTEEYLKNKTKTKFSTC